MSQQIPFNKIHIFDQYFKKRKQKKAAFSYEVYIHRIK